MLSFPEKERQSFLGKIMLISVDYVQKLSQAANKVQVKIQEKSG